MRFMGFVVHLRYAHFLENYVCVQAEGNEILGRGKPTCRLYILHFGQINNILLIFYDASAFKRVQYFSLSIFNRSL